MNDAHVHEMQVQLYKPNTRGVTKLKIQLADMLGAPTVVGFLLLHHQYALVGLAQRHGHARWGCRRPLVGCATPDGAPRVQSGMGTGTGEKQPRDG